MPKPLIVSVVSTVREAAVGKIEVSPNVGGSAAGASWNTFAALCTGASACCEASGVLPLPPPHAATRKKAMYRFIERERSNHDATTLHAQPSASTAWVCALLCSTRDGGVPQRSRRRADHAPREHRPLRVVEVSSVGGVPHARRAEHDAERARAREVRGSITARQDVAATCVVEHAVEHD